MRNRPAGQAALLAAAGCLVLAPILAGTGTAAGATTSTTTTASTTTATKTTSTAAAPTTEGARTCTREHPAAPRWALAWHDEFGAPTLDRTKWNTVMDFPGRAGGHYHNSSYGSYALDANIVLGQGRLHLITDDEPVVGDDPPGTYAYSEGFVSSTTSSPRRTATGRSARATPQAAGCGRRSGWFPRTAPGRRSSTWPSGSTASTGCSRASRRVPGRT